MARAEHYPEPSTTMIIIRIRRPDGRTSLKTCRTRAAAWRMGSRLRKLASRGLVASFSLLLDTDSGVTS